MFSFRIIKSSVCICIYINIFIYVVLGVDMEDPVSRPAEGVRGRSAGGLAGDSQLQAAYRGVLYSPGQTVLVQGIRR